MQSEWNLPSWSNTPFQTGGEVDGRACLPPPTHLLSGSNDEFPAHGSRPSKPRQQTYLQEIWPTDASFASETTKRAAGDEQRHSRNQPHHSSGRFLQLTEPRAKREVGIFCTIIKAAHHLEKLLGNIPPRFIHNLTWSLSKKIHPFMLSTNTAHCILKNAENWRNGLVSILRSHYHLIIEEELKLLNDLPVNQWVLWFQTAANWARKSLNSCLLSTVLSKTWNLIKKIFPEATDMTPLEASQPSWTGDGTTASGASACGIPPRTVSSSSTRGRQSPSGNTRGVAPTKTCDRGIPPTSTRRLRTVATQTHQIKNSTMKTVATQMDLPVSKVTIGTQTPLFGFPISHLSSNILPRERPGTSASADPRSSPKEGDLLKTPVETVTVPPPQSEAKTPLFWCRPRIHPALSSSFEYSDELTTTPESTPAEDHGPCRKNKQPLQTGVKVKSKIKKHNLCV